MAKMKVKDFITKAEKIKVSKTLYQLGTYGNKKKGDYTLYDCSGLIKAILWGYPSKVVYESNGFPDINSTTMISRCTSVTTDFKKAKAGWLVFLDAKSGVDHIGIYIGDGIVIEATPAWRNGVQKSFCKGSGYKNTQGLKERQWTKCGKFDKYIDYTEETVKPTPPKPTGSTKVKELQKALNSDLGVKLDVDGIIGSKTKAAMNKVVIKKPLLRNNKDYPAITKFVQKYVGVSADGIYGTNSKNAVKKFQKKVGITQDGEVGINTLTKLVS